MKWLALDIGGANIKVANGRGFAASYTFPLWRRPTKLAGELRKIIQESPQCDRIVATMTGELADCYADKNVGVCSIVDALQQAADGRHTRIYLNDGKIVSSEVAKRRWMEAAAANWHALASYCGRLVKDGKGLLLDIGSTTCDVIPLLDGQPIATGKTDTQRLCHGELVYTGVERSPVCAIVDDVPYRDGRCPVAQELFATTLDAYVVLGDVPEDTTKTMTADGRPATKAAARVRLGRAICADSEEFNHRDAVGVAREIATAQQQLLAKALSQVVGQHGTPARIVLSGHGDFLAKAALTLAQISVPTVRLESELGEIQSRCASAHALAVLAGEQSEGAR